MESGIFLSPKLLTGLRGCWGFGLTFIDLCICTAKQLAHDCLRAQERKTQFLAFQTICRVTTVSLFPLSCTSVPVTVSIRGSSSHLLSSLEPQGKDVGVKLGP